MKLNDYAIFEIGSWVVLNRTGELGQVKNIYPGSQYGVVYCIFLEKSRQTGGYRNDELSRAYETI